MSSKNKAPIDGYSRQAYEKVLNDVAEKEALLAHHPLSKEIDIHKKLREEMKGSPYPMVEDEQSAVQKFEEETGGVKENIAVLRRDLGRQLGNAQREAIAENEKRDGEVVASELLPKIEEMKRDTEATLERIGEVPGMASSLARAIIADAETAKQIGKERSRSGFGQAIIEIFVRIKELYQRFKEFVSSFFASDRYGGDRQSP